MTRLRALVAPLLVCTLSVLLAAAPSADAAVSRSAAAKKALVALGSVKSDRPVIVFGLRRPLRPGALIAQSAPSGPAGAPATTRFARARQRRIRRAGADVRRASVIMRSGSEAAWFFYEDQSPHQNYEHPGRVVLVGARSGRVRIGRPLRWVPLVDGRQPAFFRSAKSYESKRFRVLSRPFTTAPAQTRARVRRAMPSAADQQVADALAAERSCALRVSDTLGDFLDFGRVDRTRARLGLFFEELEKLNAGFVSRRYTTKGAQTPIEVAQDLIDDAGCRDLLLYTAGAASRTSDGVVVGMRAAPGGTIEWHVLRTDDLATLVAANPDVTFKFLFDAPYTAQARQRLAAAPNTVLLLAAGGPEEGSFTYLPEVAGPDGPVRLAGNPDRLLEFTNAILAGLEAFTSNPQELATWLAGRALGGPSMMSWMLARSLGLSPAWMFAAPIDTLKLPVMPTTPPGGPGATPPPPIAVNHAPLPTTPAQPTQEDTPRAITLSANDPDGDPLTFSVTDLPDHGTLTGTAPNLLYTPSQDFDGDDAFSYEVADNRGAGAAQTVEIPITPGNDAAVATTSGAGPTFTEDGAPDVVDGGLTISDPDSAELEGATARITDGTRQTGDMLDFTPTPNVTGVYDTATGILTLTGDAPLAEYETALRSATFDSTHQDPTASRTVEFRAEDGDDAGAPAEQTITITPVNDAPTLSALGGTLAYTENLGATAIDTDVTTGDVDSSTLAGATVQITGGYANGEDVLALPAQASGITASFDASTGTLTLSGARTGAQYQTALQSITYDNLSENPDTTTRTVSWQLDDGAGANNLSSVGTRDISVTAGNDKPIVGTSTGSAGFTEGGSAAAVDPDVTVTDVDDTHIEGASITITDNLSAHDVLVLGNNAGGLITAQAYDSSTGVLMLSGSATKAQYQTALRSVTFSSAGENPSAATRTVRFRVDDGGPAGISDDKTRTVTVTAVNDAPVLGAIGGTLSYQENDAPAAIDTDLTLTDADSTHLSGATVQITGNYADGQDVLALPTQSSGITGTFDATAGRLTLGATGAKTLAEYRTALQAVTYENTSNDPATASNRTVSFQVTDVDGTANGGDDTSDVQTRDISVAAVNDAPVITLPTAAPTFTENGSATVIDGALTLTDADNAQLSSATVKLTTNYVEAEDVLGFTDTTNIDGAFVAATGTLTLVPQAGESPTVEDFRDALRTVTFATSGEYPSGLARTVAFQADDGSASNNLSTVKTTTVGVVPVNDAPVLAAGGASPSFTEDGSAAVVDGGLTVEDVDDATLSSATVSIGGGQSGDALNFSDTAKIDGTFSAGTLTLVPQSGETPTVSEYEAALRSVTFSTTNQDPTTSRTISFRVDDGNASTNLSNVVQKALAIAPVNDAPGNAVPAAQSMAEGATLTFSSANLNQISIADVDAQSGTVDVALSVLHGTLSAAQPAGGSRTGDGTASLTLSGTVTAVNTALNGLTYTPSLNYDAGDTLGVETDDNGNTGSGGTLSDDDDLAITVNGINDAPSIATSTGETTDEDTPVTLNPSPSITDVDAGGDDIEVSLSAVDGMLSLASTVGLAFQNSTTNNSTSMTFRGTTAAVNAALSGLRYAPDADFSGNDSVAISVDDLGNNPSGALTDSAATPITVTAVNDAPVLDLDTGESGQDSSATFLEVTTNDNEIPVAPAVGISDVDNGAMGSATITLTNRPDGSAESLSVDTTGTNITASPYDASTGQLTLTGSDTKAHYAQVIQTLTYSNSAAPPNAADRQITVVVNDGAANSNTANADVEVVPLNAPPTLDLDGANPSQDSSAAFVEDGGAEPITPSGTTIADGDDANMESATVTLTNPQDGAAEELAATSVPAGITVDDYDTNTHTLFIHGSASKAAYETVLESVTYDNSSQNPDETSRDITVVVNDGQDDSSTRRAAVSVARNNDAITNTVPGPLTPAEDSTVTFSPGNSNAISIADADAGSGEVKVTVSADHGSFLSTVPTNGTRTGNGTHTLELTGAVAAVNAALNGMSYGVDANYDGTDTITVLSDDQGNTGGTQTTDSDTIAVTLTKVNDAPRNTVPTTTQLVDEDATLEFAAGWGNQISVADIDAGAGSVQVTLGVTFGTLRAPLPAGGSRTGNGTASFVLTGTVAAVNTALNSLVYTPDADENGPETLTVTTSDQGNTGSGGTLTDTDNVTITVTPVNDVPTAADNEFGGTGPGQDLNDQAHGNTAYVVDEGTDDKAPPTVQRNSSQNETVPHTEIEGDILGDDSDDDGPGPLVVQSAGRAASAGTDGVTEDLGSVSVEPDGDFVYLPPVRTSCDDGTDQFTYVVSDQAASGAGPIPGTSTATVTIHLEGCVWYVHNFASGNSGTAIAPFDSTGHAETESGPDDTVFVFDGDDTSGGHDGDDPRTGADSQGYAMNAGERLIGESEGLTVDQDRGTANNDFTPDVLHAAVPTRKPSLRATNFDVVQLDDGNEIKGFNIDPLGTSSGIAGGSVPQDVGGTIQDVNIEDTGTPGSRPLLELNGTGGTFNISNFTATNMPPANPPNTETGVRLLNAGTVNFAAAGTTQIAIKNAKAIDASGTNMGTSTFDDITVSGSSVGGVNLLNTTGTTTLGDGTGTDLSLTTTASPTAALKADNVAGLTVGAGGTDTITAGGGPAVDVVSAPGAVLAFDQIQSTSSTTDGVNLDGLGTGTFEAAATSTITGAAVQAFDLHGGNGPIDYPGTLGNGGGGTAEITGRTGGDVTFTGAINDTSDNGGGISVGLAGVANANTGGTTTFSNATKTLNTGTADALTFTNSAGHTLDLLGGGLDIDTTTGRGINATSGGTINLSGPNPTNNTVTTGGGRAVNVENTSFGASGFTLQSVTTTGIPSQADHGIHLDTTGPTAGMTITGNGGDGSGGTITNTTLAAVSLKDTDDFSADELNISGPNQSGVLGRGVSDFTYTDGTITNAGDSKTNAEHAAFAFNYPQDATAPGNENNLDGTVTITGNTMTGQYGAGLAVHNFAGTITDANISSNAISSGIGADNSDDAIALDLFGTSSSVASLTKGTIQNNTISGHEGAGIKVQGSQTSTAGSPVGSIGTPGSVTNRLLISNNLVTGNPGPDASTGTDDGIGATMSGRGNTNVHITNNGTAANPITGVDGHGIFHGVDGAANGEFHITGNRLEIAPNLSNAGIRGASGSWVTDSGTLSTPVYKGYIQNNYVRGADLNGIRVLLGGGPANSGGSSQLKVTGNDATGGSAAAAISVENGANNTQPNPHVLCTDISGNVAVPGPGSSVSGIVLRSRGSAGNVGPTNIVGFGGGTGSAAATYLSGQNPDSTAVSANKVDVFPSAHTFGGCPTF